jgi:hypothetical protein
MPWTAKELADWTKTLGLSADDEKVVLTSLGKPETLAKVGESVMMRGDYSRSMDELKTQKERLEGEYQEKVRIENEFHKKNSTWATNNATLLKKAQDDARDAKARLDAFTTKVKEFATAQGIPEEDLAEVLKEAPPASGGNGDRRQDTGGNGQGELDSRYMTEEKFNEVAGKYVLLPALITKLERTHFALFGNDGPAPDWEKLIFDARKNEHTLQQEWELQFKVPERREAIAKATHDREMKDAEERGRTAARSELLAEHPELVSGTRTLRTAESPVLHQAREKAKVEKRGDGLVDEHRGVRAAVTAFNEGKYAEKEP